MRIMRSEARDHFFASGVAFSYVEGTLVAKGKMMTKAAVKTHVGGVDAPGGEEAALLVGESLAGVADDAGIVHYMFSTPAEEGSKVLRDTNYIRNHIRICS